MVSYSTLSKAFCKGILSYLSPAIYVETEYSTGFFMSVYKCFEVSDIGVKTYYLRGKYYDNFNYVFHEFVTSDISDKSLEDAANLMIRTQPNYGLWKVRNRDNND